MAFEPPVLTPPGLDTNRVGTNELLRISREQADQMTRFLLAVARSEVDRPPSEVFVNMNPDEPPSTVFGRTVLDSFGPPTDVDPIVINTLGDVVESEPEFMQPLDPVSPQWTSDSAGAGPAYEENQVTIPPPPADPDGQVPPPEPPEPVTGSLSAFTAAAPTVATTGADYTADIIAGDSLVLVCSAGDPTACAELEAAPCMVVDIDADSVTLDVDLTALDTSLVVATFTKEE